jgi:hypothetical protein
MNANTNIKGGDKMRLTGFKLGRHNGESRDYRGCQFKYECFKETAYDHEIGKRIIVSKSYQCKEFPNIKTKTLDEMKRILSSDDRILAMDFVNQIDNALSN